MKKIIVLLVLMFGFNTFVTAQEEVVEVEEIKLDWIANFEDAVAKSQETKKPIFILFEGSDWCKPCIQLEENVLDTKKFQKYAEENFVLYKADFPRNEDLVSAKNRKYNKELQKKYEQESFPTIAIIDLKGKLIEKREGVYMFDSYFPFFDGVINKIKMMKSSNQ